MCSCVWCVRVVCSCGVFMWCVRVRVFVRVFVCCVRMVYSCGCVRVDVSVCVCVRGSVFV
jgi:hypothetical protein